MTYGDPWEDENGNLWDDDGNPWVGCEPDYEYEREMRREYNTPHDH